MRLARSALKVVICVTSFLALGLALHGCLMPPAVVEVAEPENQAPRIDPDSLHPHPSRGPVRLQHGCSTVSFFARVTDPDPSDKIYWRVFLDYYRDENPDFPSEDRKSRPNPETVTFDVDPDDTHFVVGQQSGSPHLVELLISDRPFLAVGVPAGRIVEDGALTDTFSWTIQITDDLCQSGSGS